MLTPPVRRLPPADWVLRPALAADAGELARLCAAHAAYEQIPYGADGHAERLAQALEAGRLNAWLVYLHGQAVGYASATLDYATLTARPFLHLDCLYLDPAARGLGLGPALLDAAVCRARALGCEHLQWQTPLWNDGAIRFYDRLGATRLAKQRYTLACAEWAETPFGLRC
ncbi:GNAT family N-acetyltransferase [Acidovorax sp. HMWF029]|uniref:GNAT family N-acetyltransferase n=1 Tax=Acidovorax sp. HMWF029 TaxID=2056863 RepID=UPI000D3B14D0|nr:GNAT family N-acetyltransferase [Acidovorax sp. HMWF029]PTT23638.1 GNAT family N-acetyltransferase [Acidovorax sp. HMWF029]